MKNTEKVYKLRYGKNSTKISCITNELDSLKKDGLKIDSSDGIVELTKYNSNLVKNKLINDEDYYPFTKTLVKYFGKRCVITNSKDKNVDGCENGALFAILREIDRDNNTNAWRYGNDGKKAFNRILKYISNPENRFFEKIKSNFEDVNKRLPDKLTAIGLQIFDEEYEDKLRVFYKKQKNGLRSFSSKVCKYLCEYLYGNNNKYFVNDRYVRYALPFYLDHYKVGDFPNSNEFKKLKTSAAFNNLLYYDLHNYLSALQDKVNEGIPDRKKLEKGEIDHIIWYCYKSYRLD